MGHGDHAAFEEVYSRTSSKLFSVCLAILPGREEAEDVLQDIYAIIWRRAATFDETRGGAMTWLITVARNRAVDRLRAIVPVVALPIDIAETIADPGPDALAAMERHDDVRRLFFCIDTLEAHDVQFIRSAFLQGSTYAELADRATLPLPTVKSRIRRALLKRASVWPMPDVVGSHRSCPILLSPWPITALNPQPRSA